MLSTTSTSDNHVLFGNKYPPGGICSPDLENAFLSWMVYQPGAIPSFASIPEAAFFQLSARAVWSAILSGHHDIPGLVANIPEKHRQYFLAEVAQIRDFSGNVGNWAKEIVSLYTQREILRIAELVAMKSRLRDCDPATTIEQAISQFSAIASISNPESTMQSHEEAAGSFIEALVSAHDEEQTARVMFGWKDLDKMTGGLIPGQLVTIGARSSMGKSTLALNAAENIAAAGQPVLFISLEMTIAELEAKLLSRSSRVCGDEFRDPRQMSDHTFSRLLESVDRTQDYPLYLDDGDFCNAMDIETAILKVENRHGVRPKVVFVDYLQLMSIDDGGSRNMTQAISLLTRSLKQLAKRLGIAIVILSQLNRGVESKQDKRPMMSDLRDSGSIEQDSNMVLMVYRDAYYNPSTELGNTTEILVVKNRGGATGKVELVFDGRYSDFRGKL